ncbi:hypothetical protein PIB30_035905 [Stylosanthes scabra]|uniref:Uncharacterized protein n=1 Tax=Stylosanthes scabra TaxID=79078 RepID=A0ABU6WBB3_9FABA|nr:hypothetical protein [Stylosanthes scabra]
MTICNKKRVNVRKNPTELRKNHLEEQAHGTTGTENTRSQGHKKQKTLQQKCYYKYNKVSGHDTKDCKDFLEARETNHEIKKSMNMWTCKSKEMKNIRLRLRQRIDRPEKDDPKRHRVHREIAIVTGGIPEEGNLHLKSE